MSLSISSFFRFRRGVFSTSFHRLWLITRVCWFSRMWIVRSVIIGAVACRFIFWRRRPGALCVSIRRGITIMSGRRRPVRFIFVLFRFLWKRRYRLCFLSFQRVFISLFSRFCIYFRISLLLLSIPWVPYQSYPCFLRVLFVSLAISQSFWDYEQHISFSAWQIAQLGLVSWLSPNPLSLNPHSYPHWAAWPDSWADHQPP